LYSWVTNPKKTYDESGDDYIKSVVDEWMPKAGIMSPQGVTEEQVESVVAYLESGTAECGPGGDVGSCPTPEEEEEEGIAWAFWFILGAAIMIILFASAGVKRQLRDVNRRKQGLDPLPDTSFFDELRTVMWKHKAATSVIILIFVAGGLTDGWYTLKDVGVYGGFEDRKENYRPTQPIDFSHRIHAGCNEISCVYCHSSAEKSKHSGIPSTNVCMNCHKYIKEGKRENSVEEISKIYNAIGFDREAGVYVDDYDSLSDEAKAIYKEDEFGQPVKWVKVHNLPDHVYFNHAQHVTVGEVECQTCHGQVQEMEKVQQMAPLSMGWCINCHRKTEVKFNDTYYSAYEDYHKEIKAGDRKGVTVEDIGGLECQKCHY